MSLETGLRLTIEQQGCNYPIGRLLGVRAVSAIGSMTGPEGTNESAHEGKGHGQQEAVREAQADGLPVNKIGRQSLRGQCGPVGILSNLEEGSDHGRAG